MPLHALISNSDEECFIVTTLYQLQNLRKEALAEVEGAVASALEDPELPESELFTDIYADQGNLRVRGCDSFTWNTAQHS